jgi:hypothetical protein
MNEGVDAGGMAAMFQAMVGLAVSARCHTGAQEPPKAHVVE